MLTISVSAFGQFNGKKNSIVKYDYATYSGKPIQKGWLFSDSTYRALYKSYNAADTMMVYFEKQGERLEKIANEFNSLKVEFNQKAKDDNAMIVSQQQTIGELKKSFDSSQEDNAKIFKQFWNVGSIKLHKGTTIAVGITAGLIGYMAGKAF